MTKFTTIADAQRYSEQVAREIGITIYTFVNAQGEYVTTAHADDMDKAVWTKCGVVVGSTTPGFIPHHLRGRGEEMLTRWPLR